MRALVEAARKVAHCAATRGDMGACDAHVNDLVVAALALWEPCSTCGTSGLRESRRVRRQRDLFRPVPMALCRRCRGRGVVRWRRRS